MDALDAANCTSILDKFSQREMTVIGAKGVYLSGGEVQRIAIARAILKNANIIIMDEASAAADPENEYELQQAFQKLMRGQNSYHDCTQAVLYSECRPDPVCPEWKSCGTGNPQ